MKFIVEIEETIRHRLTVEAPTPEEAGTIAMRQWEGGADTEGECQGGRLVHVGHG